MLHAALTTAITCAQLPRPDQAHPPCQALLSRPCGAHPPPACAALQPAAPGHGQIHGALPPLQQALGAVQQLMMGSWQGADAIASANLYGGKPPQWLWRVGQCMLRGGVRALHVKALTLLCIKRAPQLLNLSLRLCQPLFKSL